LVVLVLAALVFWSPRDQYEYQDTHLRELQALPLLNNGPEPITPIPLSLDLDAGKVALGQRLFNDARFSGP